MPLAGAFCFMPVKLSIVGRTFGKLTVISEAKPRRAKCGRKVYCSICRCSCGKSCEFPNYCLTRGKRAIVSCGCDANARRVEWNKKHKLIHGHSIKGEVTSAYWCWTGMITRCYNPNTKNWPNYGGRGISVCDRWRNSFQDFLSDMGMRPSPKHSIERKNNDGNYEPSNCKWGTRSEQCFNRRKFASLSHFTSEELIEELRKRKVSVDSFVTS